MAYSENILLKLNLFKSKIKINWQNLQEEKDFCDVMLACNDKLIPSHKIILSASSSVFRNIFKQNLDQNPVIFLRGVKYEYLQSIVNFIYQGEVNIAEDDLKDFLEVAEDLKVRGLSGESKEYLNKNVESFNESPNELETFLNTTDDLETLYSEQIIGPPELENENTDNHNLGEHKKNLNSPSGSETLSRIDDLDASKTIETIENSLSSDLIISTTGLKNEKIDENNLEKIALITSEKHGNRVSFTKENNPHTCFICNKVYSDPSGLRKHKESVHEKVLYSCGECDYRATRKNYLKLHKKSVHDGVFYPCNQCSYKATQKHHLKEHVRAAHEGRRYSCDQCDYKAKQISLVNQHKETLHERIRYPCDQCDYKATQNIILKQHKAAIHEGIRFPCNECDYEATGRSNLGKHKKYRHDRKLVKCHECNKQYNDPSGLRKHKISSHKVDQYPCDQCKYNAKQRTELNIHIKIVHNI